MFSETMEGRKKDSEAWKCAVVKVREAGRNRRRNPKGREGEDIRSMEEEVNKDRNLTERRILKKIPFPVTIAKGFHLFPSRTQKLSPSALKVLGWTRPGRISRRRIQI